mgnify:CR=1 FL=1
MGKIGYLFKRITNMNYGKMLDTVKEIQKYNFFTLSVAVLVQKVDFFTILFFEISVSYPVRFAQRHLSDVDILFLYVVFLL